MAASKIVKLKTERELSLSKKTNLTKSTYVCNRLETNIDSAMSILNKMPKWIV